MSDTPQPPVALNHLREQTVHALSEHFARDNLAVEELEERLDMCYRATTLEELRALTADLPVLPQSTELTVPAEVTIPVVWEPWPASSSAAPAPVCRSLPLGQKPVPSIEPLLSPKQASAVRSSARSGWSVSRPVSSTATTTPAPVFPRACRWSAPIWGMLVASVPVPPTSRSILTTLGLAASLASARSDKMVPANAGTVWYRFLPRYSPRSL